jgi:hypothetical protein
MHFPSTGEKAQVHQKIGLSSFVGPLKPWLTAFFPGSILVPLLLELKNLGPHNME